MNALRPQRSECSLTSETLSPSFMLLPAYALRRNVQLYVLRGLLDRPAKKAPLADGEVGNVGHDLRRRRACWAAAPDTSRRQGW